MTNKSGITPYEEERLWHQSSEFRHDQNIFLLKYFYVAAGSIIFNFISDLYSVINSFYGSVITDKVGGMKAFL